MKNLPVAIVLSVTAICSQLQADQAVLLPTADSQAVQWQYTTSQPSDDWMRPEFDDTNWQRGRAGFGTRGTPSSVIGTTWNTPEIWLRTTFDYDGRDFQQAILKLHFDEDPVIYLNGKQIAKVRGYTTSYGHLVVTESIRQAIRKGKNVAAVHARQSYGGQYIDAGIILDPNQVAQLTVHVPADRPESTGPLPPITPLFDHPVRDTSICLGPDGTYYLTGTTANHSGGSQDKAGWWYVNEGIRIWKSRDLEHWEPLGLVWSLDRDATWAKQFQTDEHGDRRRACSVPDIHYLRDTFWLTYCMNYGGCGLLKSTSGKAEGPYVDVKPDSPLTGQIDASLFQDDDGTVYWVYQNGKIARMNDDLTGLAEPPRLLQPEGNKQVGFEGAFLTKRNGRYYLICADFLDRQYDCVVAASDSVYGPYGRRYIAIPHGGHNMFFTDRDGNWWATFFGNDATVPFRERPAILRIELDQQGRVRPK